VTCPHCGNQLVNDARFCPACGKSLSPTEAHAQTVAAEPEIIGRDIGGRFRVLAKLGEGGMGSVYRGEQTSLHRPCAIKLLKPELSENPMLLRRFNAEAAVVAKLSHPNTVNIIDFGQDHDGTLFIAMELIDGKSLRRLVQAEAPMPPQRALAIASQIAASIADAHAQGIVHRDLKPDNVMIQERGRQRDVVRVLDFGIAKLRDDSRATQASMTQAGDMLGTPQYMAPEQIQGAAVDGRADIYALGCILYEMLTGRQPFEAPTVMAMLSKHLLELPPPPSIRRPDLGITAEVNMLVMAALQKDPRARPATMEAYGERIASVAAQLPPLAGVPSRPSGQPSAQIAPVPSPPPGMPYGTPAHLAFTPQSYSRPPATATRAGGGSGMLVLVIVGAVVLAGGAIALGLVIKNKRHLASTAPTPSQMEPADPSPPPPSDPWGNAAQAPRPSGQQHEYTCDQVTEHVGHLVTDAVQQMATRMTPQQLQQAAPRVAEAYKQFLLKVQQECVSQDPPDLQRECFMNAPTLADLDKCK
jgi:serine/threonine-protein kinase